MKNNCNGIRTRDKKVQGLIIAFHNPRASKLHKHWQAESREKGLKVILYPLSIGVVNPTAIFQSPQ
jgi:hypothetical protein